MGAKIPKNNADSNSLKLPDNIYLSAKNRFENFSLSTIENSNVFYVRRISRHAICTANRYGG